MNYRFDMVDENVALRDFEKKLEKKNMALLSPSQKLNESLYNIETKLITPLDARGFWSQLTHSCGTGGPFFLGLKATYQTAKRLGASFVQIVDSQERPGDVRNNYKVKFYVPNNK